MHSDIRLEDPVHSLALFQQLSIFDELDISTVSTEFLVSQMKCRPKRKAVCWHPCPRTSGTYFWVHKSRSTTLWSVETPLL